MPDNFVDKLKEFLTTMDELRDDIFFQYKRVGDLKQDTQPPVSVMVKQIEDALKVDIMIITQLRKDMTEHFNVLSNEFQNGIKTRVTKRELKVKEQLQRAISSVDNLRVEMHQDKGEAADKIKTQLEDKYKAREKQLIKKLKDKRKEDLKQFQSQLKNQEKQLKKELMSTIDSVDKLRQEITNSSLTLEEELRNEITQNSKKQEKSLVRDLEIRMKTELKDLEEKYKSEIALLESELQRAQKRIKELRGHS
jgi:chromosome segregation ATPase